MPPLSLAYPRPDIAVVTLDRPEKLNALNFELVEALHHTLEEINRMQAVLAEVRPQSSLWLHSLGYDGAKFRACAGRTTMAQ